jgi:hypothetical protein
MNMNELNEDMIRNSIGALDLIDYETITIAEIESLLSPIFKGYSIKAPIFDQGLHIYRCRIFNTNKPNDLHELSYPKNEHIRKYGRANDIGKSMFYGSISKNIPFFELKIKAGDKIAMSIWKTKDKLLLNHIGFTKEVEEKLKSGRSLSSIYDFVSETKNFNNLNNFVYNYLANCFSKNVSELNNNLYKLSVAIANILLAGDLLQGILYPTVAMSGNSDNIVLKPEYVDENLEFISVEYLNITGVVGQKYSFDTLDSATEIINGKILWSGKSLGWEVGSEKQFYRHSGSDWIGTNKSGERSKLKPIGIINKNITDLEKKYLKDFGYAFRCNRDVSVKTKIETLNVKSALLLDFKKKLRFLSFYIPISKNPIEICQTIIKDINMFVSMDKEMIIGQKNEITNRDECMNNDLLFENEINFYSESYFNSDIFKKNGLIVNSHFPNLN